MNYNTSDWEEYKKITAQRLHEKYIRDEYEKLAGKKEDKKKKSGVARHDLERNFLSAVMASLGYLSWGEVKEKYGTISWRYFKERRHQTLWRALMEIDIPGFEERLDILIKEQQEAGKEINLEECMDWARTDKWFMRELEEAEVLRLIGGRTFLLDLLACYPVSIEADLIAKKLRFI